MALSEYRLGSRVRLRAAFAVGGTASDPTSVTAQVKDPGGTVSQYSSPTVVHDGAGSYHLDVTADRQGQWAYRFVGSGAVVAADEGAFIISLSEFD